METLEQCVKFFQNKQYRHYNNMCNLCKVTLMTFKTMYESRSKLILKTRHHCDACAAIHWTNYFNLNVCSKNNSALPRFWFAWNIL